MNGEEYAKKPIRILHLEDSPRDAEIIRELLTGGAFSPQIDRALNRREFDSFLQRGGYELILADYMVPDIEAPEALSMARALCPDVPFIVVSGAIGEEKAVDLLIKGATDYVLKDNLDKLPISIRRALAEVEAEKSCRLAEESARENEARYRRIVDTANEGIWVLGPDSTTTFVNAKMAEMLGYGDDEMVGEPVTSFLFEADVPAHLGRMEKRVQGMAESYELHYRRKDGEAIWAHVSAQPIMDAENRYEGVVAMVTDITERKKSLERLFLLDFALNQVAEAVYMINEDAVFVYVNDEACRALGYVRQELLTMRIMDIDPDMSLAGWIGHWKDIHARGSMVFEGRHRARNGMVFPVEIAANYFEYEGRSYNLALVRDISDRKKAGEIKRLVEQATALSNELSKMVASYEVIDLAPSLSELGFSSRQIEIARALIAGAPSKEIALNLNVVESTIKSHIAQMYRKIGATGRMEFSNIVAERGLRLE